LGLHQSIEREQFSAGFCFTWMAFHHPVYQVNQAIGGVRRGGQGAFDSLFHQGIPRFLNRLNLSHNAPKPKVELFRIDHHRVRSRKIDLEKVQAPPDKTCPKCGFTITPDLVKRVDFERIECPKCGEKFGG
jgi:hypothetical protein